MLLAYLGPDTVLPLTSVIAAVAGGVMMFGRGIVGAARRGLERIMGRSSSTATPRRGDVLKRRSPAPEGRTPGAPHIPLGVARETESSNAS